MTEQYIASIPEIAELTFYPDDDWNQAGKEIAEIFKNRIARTLWLAIKYQHLTSTKFNEAITDIARWIEDGELDEDDDQAGWQLHGWLQPPYYSILGSNERPFARKLIPYIRGDKIIAYRLPNGDLIGGTQAEMELI